MGRTEILRRIWLFSANKRKSSKSFSKHPTHLIVELNSSLQYIIVTMDISITKIRNFGQLLLTLMWPIAWIFLKYIFLEQKTLPGRREEATFQCIKHKENYYVEYINVWATPCDGRIECLYGIDEIGCDSNVRLLLFILLGVIIALFTSLFCYLQQNIFIGIVDILTHQNQVKSSNRPVSDKSKKLIFIAFLIEKQMVDEIRKFYQEEVKTHGTEGKALCCLKVNFDY